MGKVLTFKLCGALFGIDIILVKEINRNVEYTPIPDSPPHIVGLFNMRGQIVTLFDLGKFMNYSGEFDSTVKTCIILKAAPNDPNQIGFLIEGSGDVIDISPDSCEPPPSNVGGIDGEFIESIVKLEDDLLMILNPKKIFES